MSNFNYTPITTVRRDNYAIAWLFFVHVMLLAAPFTFSWAAAGAALFLYFVTGCLGITLGYHRLLTHRSLKAPRWVERALATCGALAMEGSPLEWVAHHRMHHAGTDSHCDPHNAHRGFWFSHVGWIFYQVPDFDDSTRIRKFARDITADPYLAWLSKPTSLFGMQIALAGILFALGGVGFVVWGIFVRLVSLYHVTWFVNSVAHKWGYRNYETPDLSTNSWWVALLGFGEGWHNNHHAQPDAVHVQHRWWELDITWQAIKVLNFFGLIKSMKLPT